MTFDDESSATEEFFRDQALKFRKPELPKIGVCYNCGEKVQSNYNFCDCDCRVDFERRTENSKGR